MALDGTYKGVVKALTGSTACEMTIKQRGNVLTGTASAMGVTSPINDGRIDGDSFTCKIEGDGPLGHMIMDVAGVAKGDVISGTIKVGRISAKFEATRA